MTTLFVSDLHLEAAKPEIAEQFLEFLKVEAVSSDALYVLGDLFEYWVGDDDPNAHYATIKEALHTLVDHKVPVFLMHGNRDFMIGDAFARETGVTLLPDPHLLDIHGSRVLLCHGDAMCTDDVKYQEVRKMTRNPEWFAMMMQKSLAERQALGAQARAASMAHGDTIHEAIQDVNQTAVERNFREYGVATILHGHTHRPAIHKLEIDGNPVSRIVLGDWFTQGSVVRWDKDGPVLSAMERQHKRDR
jgi:UDP-2,3-diacylglucosamine hydrolase